MAQIRWTLQAADDLEAITEFRSLQPPGSNFVWSGPSTLSSTRMPPGIVYLYGGRDLNTQNLDRLSISITVKE